MSLVSPTVVVRSFHLECELTAYLYRDVANYLHWDVRTCLEGCTGNTASRFVLVPDLEDIIHLLGRHPL